jgi:accessory gene regulator protein AgrB
MSIGMDIWRRGIGIHAIVFILNAVTINDEVVTYMILGSFFNTAIVYPLMFRYLQEQLDNQKPKREKKK